MTAPVAAIDCGTNTIKLLIGELPEVAVREMRMVRLGQGVDRTGVLAADALARTFAAIDEYAELIGAHGVERLRFVATSATRDAANAEEFVAGVRARLGVDPEVVSGTEEAALAFDGAVRHLRAAPEMPVLVLDIGGGSTELIVGSHPSRPPAAAVSMDIGSVRLHERHLRSDPPAMAEVTALVHEVDQALAASSIDLARARTLVGVAGTITTLAAGVLGLEGYSREAIDQARLPVKDLHALVDRLLSMTVNERLQLPWLHPGRADVIGAGGVILGRILRQTRVEEIVVSESDILDGIAWSLVE